MHKKIIEVDVETKNPRSTARVVIHVKDINDCYPKFDEDLYTEFVPESSPIASKVLKVHASDIDSGLNGDITYSIDSNVFIIDSYTGMISIASLLNFEMKSLHVFTVTAHDRGKPSFSGKAKIKIHVTNVNDNVPRFTTNFHSFTILENAEPGSLITKSKNLLSDIQVY